MNDIEKMKADFEKKLKNAQRENEIMEKFPNFVVSVLSFTNKNVISVYAKDHCLMEKKEISDFMKSFPITEKISASRGIGNANILLDAEFCIWHYTTQDEMVMRYVSNGTECWLHIDYGFIVDDGFIKYERYIMEPEEKKKRNLPINRTYYGNDMNFVGKQIKFYGGNKTLVDENVISNILLQLQ